MVQPSDPTAAATNSGSEGGGGGAATASTTTSYSASSLGRLAYGAAMAITERLSDLPDLSLPSSLYKDGRESPQPAAVLAYLQALLAKDPAAFLARYGGVLQTQELNHFEALRSADWEVAHWLSHYGTQRMQADPAADPRRLPARTKNRRLAAMRRLATEGEYFSEESMRQRAPLLYHQAIGRYAPRQPHGGGGDEGAGGDGAEGEQEQGEGAAGACGKPGTSGGWGGNCLAAALQQAMRAQDGTAAAAETRAGTGAAGDAGAGPSGPSHRAAGPGPSSGAPKGPSGAGGSEAEMADARAGPGPGSGPGPGPSSGAAGAAAAGGGRRGPWPAGPGGAGGGGGAGAGEMRFSEFLLRQNDEALIEQRRMEEQRAEDEQLSEHDSDDEDGTEEERKGTESQDEGAGAGAGGRARPQGGNGGKGTDPDDDDDDEMEDADAEGDHARRRAQGRGGAAGGKSAFELAELRREFLSEMQSRFLTGQDGAYVDYAGIDADQSLDADWIEEESRDAEERYFDED
ncbi:hypothetical protein HYH03_002926 [Edaphochlamys debaryana]|uniref:CCD97-like C-terminal domain-containing protein n=1 Tax=Edaphochlamys debaryana TaxID=47281 RepID=A0A835YB30_9CHLO|nr:hypothetical protein HYH03_002926 [Edaphochlamys debaryana]|eukprot:KAG2499351.1 hypothetical protein HYH03_002926 [Edaphochlamys debaryana]